MADRHLSFPKLEARSAFLRLAWRRPWRKMVRANRSRIPARGRMPRVSCHPMQIHHRCAEAAQQSTVHPDSISLLGNVFRKPSLVEPPHHLQQARNIGIDTGIFSKDYIRLSQATTIEAKGRPLQKGTEAAQAQLARAIANQLDQGPNDASEVLCIRNFTSYRKPDSSRASKKSSKN